MEPLYNIIKGKVEAAEFTVTAGSPVLDPPLMELQLKKDVLIAAIIRRGDHGERSVVIPRGSDTISEGDGVVVVARAMSIKDISDILA